MLHQTLPRRALVVADDPGERRAFCRDLREAGYSPVGFDSCADAAAWLDEETPSVAVLRLSPDRLCGELLDELDARCVELVVDGEPVQPRGC
jgi:DNA-binding NtrC family response regulator